MVTDSDMAQHGHLDNPNLYPSRFNILTFRAKATLLQLRRVWVNVWNRSVQKYSKAGELENLSVIATSVTPLWTTQDSSEQHLIAGKVQNLRVALQHINGIVIPKGCIFSFWTQLGKPTRAKGYEMGRELRQGCLISSLGGGLCQLSNALYSVALDAGLEMIERHAHTQVIPGSQAELGRDATVFWNYIDLRFKAHEDLRIEAFLTSTSLVVELKSRAARTTFMADSPREMLVEHSAFSEVHACNTCHAVDCIRYSPPVADAKPLGRTAYLVDDYWPEFDQYLKRYQGSADLLAVPLRGDRWRKSNYAWTTAGFQQVREATGITLGRSLASRQWSAQGKSRQEKLLKYDRTLALRYAQWLTYDIQHVVVMQHLLPWLWQAGYLEGRTFDVLMTRLPILALQVRLNQAYQNHPYSTTLNDFRADLDLVKTEDRALKAARHLITPHSDVARCFPNKTILLDWVLPNIKLPNAKSSFVPEGTILFAASTLGRKGAYELREVAKAYSLPLKLLGAELESDRSAPRVRSAPEVRFWDGVVVTHTSGDPLDGVGLVVLPAYVEHCPRLLLRAVASGIPVIASAACGLEQVSGVTTIPMGDVQAFAQSIESLWLRSGDRTPSPEPAPTLEGFCAHSYLNSGMTES
jgi:VanW like protein/Glycosyl transferases group 1